MCSVSVSFSFVFKLKTAYEMRISDWSSDVCSSDLPQVTALPTAALAGIPVADATLATGDFQAGAMAVGRSAGDDIDHRHQCIGARSEERRVGKECVGTRRSRWSRVLDTNIDNSLLLYLTIPSLKHKQEMMEK